jgi:uncharacterized protein
MTSQLTRVDKARFGPWAIVTGSSSGIGREFARQLAASGLDLVLVARRLDALEGLGRELAGRFGIEYRAVGLDLSADDFMDRLVTATRELDIGLVVSNAGAVLRLGTDIIEQSRDDLDRMLRLNTRAHLGIAHHFGRRLADRGRGGLLLTSSLGGRQGWPGGADYAASKAFVLVLGESLHVELGKHGVTVTVVLPGATDTEMVRSYGVDAKTMKHLMRPMGLMSVEQVVAEGLRALNANRPSQITGLVNRMVATLLPRGAFTRMLGSMSTRLRTERTAIQAAA